LIATAAQNCKILSFLPGLNFIDVSQEYLLDFSCVALLCVWEFYSARLGLQVISSKLSANS